MQKVQCDKERCARREGKPLHSLQEQESDLDILAAGTAAINQWANANQDKSLSLRNAKLADSDLSGAILRRADLSGAEFRNCKFVDSKFDGAILNNTRFLDCELNRASFQETDLSSVEMSACILDGTMFRQAKSFSQIRSLQTCRIEDRSNDVYFDQSRCRFLDRYLGWNRIRAVGELRLFLPSYAALILSIAVLSSIAFFNNQLRLGQTFALQLLERRVIDRPLYEKLIEATQPVSPSWRHFAVLASTFAIALGATLYLVCPSRVKEFTVDQWRYLADRPVFEYYADAWTFSATRIACVIAYGGGALIAIILLGDTLVRLLRLLASSL
jgi:hypothetical protein